jgi:hypothetical protein
MAGSTGGQQILQIHNRTVVLILEKPFSVTGDNTKTCLLKIYSPFSIQLGMLIQKIQSCCTFSI